MELNTLYNGNCMDYLPDMANDSVNLTLTDIRTLQTMCFTNNDGAKIPSDTFDSIARIFSQK